jgi:hypothetical protein
MESVFVVQHLHVLPDGEEDVKLIGVYRSAETAMAAVRRLQVQPGFSAFPYVIDASSIDDQGFHVEEYQLDLDHWSEGYETI